MVRISRWAALSALAATISGCTCGPVCRPGGTGTVVVTFSGLPDSVSGAATLTGPSEQSLTHSETLTHVGSGDWAVAAQKAVQPDPRVRTVFAPTPTPSAFCLADGATQTVNITWAPIPTSNKLWMSNRSGGTGEAVAFASSALAATGAWTASPGSRASPSTPAATFGRARCARAQ